MLLHGVMGSERMWESVMAPLGAHHDVIALTALGHRGGPPWTSARPARIADVVDTAERQLDELGLVTPHLAGNSMGGWVALELARRGRARSVCALSPAGCWDPAEPGHGLGRDRLRATVRMTRTSRPLLGLLARARWVRHFALRDTAVHGERIAPLQLVGLAEDRKSVV